MRSLTPLALLLITSLALAACDGDDAADATAGTATAGTATAGTATAGTATAGTATAGTATAGTATAGTNTAGTATAGTTTAGTATAGTATAGAATAGAATAGTAGAAMGGDPYIEVGGMNANEPPREYPPIDDASVPGQGIHQFTMTDIYGQEVDLRHFRGKVALVVNVASRCGYTRQYEDLQVLYEQYQDRGLVILGFPANNFGSQEPGTEGEILEFCTANYGVTFPMFGKISVKGADMHPLYAYLTGESGAQVSWNFNKFLVATDGRYSHHYQSTTEPLSAELTSAIEALLPAQP